MSHRNYADGAIGKALLRAILPALNTEGRDLVAGQGITAGGDGEGWATALGFTRAHEFILQALMVADVDPSLWGVAMPDGYRLERWIGEAPADLLDSYAHGRSAIHDAPLGDSSYRPPHWMAERVREGEDQARARGVEVRLVVAVHEASNEV